MIIVCHIANHITGKADGVYSYLKMIFQNSDKEKIQHSLIYQGGEKIKKELSEIGVKIFECDSLKKKIPLKAFKDISAFIRNNEIDVIHTHLIKPYAISGLVNIFLRRKHIFNYHGLFIYNNTYYGLTEKIIYGAIHIIINFFRAVDAVLVPSKKSKELLMAETKLFPEPLVYYNGYDSNTTITETDSELYLRIENLKKENKIIAIVGRLEVDKRIDRALSIFKNIIAEYPKVHLLVFGHGKLENYLIDLTKEFNLLSNVSFLGYVPDVKNYYHLFDIVLFTSDWEGMPLTMWESMANEVPVLAPDVGGFKEILEENNCGLIYYPGDLNDAGLKLLQLIENNTLRKSLGNKGRKAVEEKYNSKNFINQIESIYSNLLNDKKDPSFNSGF